MPELDKVYCHLFNGGMTFSIVDEDHGPTVKISSMVFGNLQQETKLMTDRPTLRMLGEMFLRAAERPFSPEYVHKATAVEEPCFEASSSDGPH